MTAQSLFAMVTFALIASITPGPNNIMLMSSGVNFGFRRSVPHIAGVQTGFFSLLVGVGLGLGMLFELMPGLYLALKVAGATYLIYLAWRIAMSRAIGEAGTRAVPLTFWQAAVFQWVNPKAWIMTVMVIATFTQPGAYVMSVALICLSFLFVGTFSSSSWAGFGVLLRAFLDDPVRLKWFNIIMGVLLVVSLYPMLA